jgi:hypothetical protein
MTYKAIEYAIRDVLKNDPLLIAAGIGPKIYPKVLPQNAVLPAITYDVLADIPYDDISGNAGLYRAVIEFKIRSKTDKESSEIEDLLRLAIQGYQGINLNVSIRGVHHLHRMSDFDGEVTEYNLVSRYGIFYRRENPDHGDS